MATKPAPMLSVRYASAGDISSWETRYCKTSGTGGRLVISYRKAMSARMTFRNPWPVIPLRNLGTTGEASSSRTKDA